MFNSPQLTLALSPSNREMLIHNQSMKTPLGKASRIKTIFKTRIQVMEMDENPVVFQVQQGFLHSGPIYVFDSCGHRAGWFQRHSLFHSMGSEWGKLSWESKTQWIWHSPGKLPLAILIHSPKKTELYFTADQQLGPFARMLLLGHTLWHCWNQSL